MEEGNGVVGLVKKVSHYIMSKKSDFELKQIPIEHLQRGAYQPRRHFSEEALAELAQSIQASGLIQPIVVRPISFESYEIVAGERRWRAAQMAGLERLPCLINPYNDQQAAAVSTIENVNRVNLSPIEEAKAYQRMVDEFAYQHDEIAAIVGKSRTRVTNALRLLKCAARVQQLLEEETLTEGHARAIAGLPFDQQPRWAERCVAKSWSVRQLEREIKASHLSAIKGGQNEESDPDMATLQSALSDYLGCQVKVVFDGQHCRLSMDCHTLEIFEGVLERIGFRTP